MHDGHRNRLKKRYREHGADALEDHELVELLLCYAIPRRDVNPIAHRLLKSFGSLQAMLNAPIPSLCETEGVGESSALLIRLMGDIEKRARRQQIASRRQLNSLETAGAYLQTLLEGRDTEAFYVLFLDNQHRLIRAECIGEGSHSEARVIPRDVVTKALFYGAAHVILGHNHPGGTCKPSTADVQLTEKLKKLLQGMGIGCLEHYIIADDRVYAMGASRLIELQNSEADGLRAGEGVARENMGVTDPYELARILKSLEMAQLDIILAELADETD